MKKKFFWLPIFLCVAILSCSLYCTSPDDENYDIIWRKANSPIYIDSCFVVPEGQTLMIQPGVEVRFKSSRYNHCYDSLGVGMLYVKGNIIARGTRNDSIVFTRDGDEYSWGLICIDSTSTIINSFQYCKILHSGTLYDLYECCDYGYGGPYDCGSVFFHKSTGKVQDCYFNDNYCGVFCYNSTDPQIRNNSFVDNGFDVFCEEYSTPDIEGNKFVNNLSGYETWYNSIRSNKSSPKIEENYITGYTYAIFCDIGGNPEIMGNTIERNAIGIVYYEDINGIIIGNTLTRHQYPLACGSGSSPLIIDNLITNNQSGISCYDNANPYILNNTITNNGYTKETYRGISCDESSSPVIYNTIVNGFRDNLYICDPSCYPVISYSFIQSDSLPLGFEDGGNNIINANLDPLFVDEENGNCQLQHDSPCVNAANSNVAGLPETDILGNPRISGSEVDIGAYEFQE